LLNNVCMGYNLQKPAMEVLYYMLSFLNFKYFLLLSEELNFGNAAKKLHITQQSLSGHIKKMEEYLGVELFKYGPPLEITAAGLLLKEHAIELLSKEKALETDMLEMKNQKQGTINIGCTYARAEFLMPPILRDFQTKYPLIKISLLEGNTPDIEKALKKGELDVSVGFTPHNVKDIISIPLYHDPFRMVVHPSVLFKYFPDRKPVIFRCYEEKLIKEILNTCPFLTMTTRTTIGKFGYEYLKKLNITPNTLMELKDVGTMLAMCYSGMGFILCPETFVNHSFYAFSKQHLIYPLPNHEAMQISINYPKHKRTSSIIQAFIKIASAALKEK